MNRSSSVPSFTGQSNSGDGVAPKDSSIALVQCEWRDHNVLIDRALVERVVPASGHSRIHLRDSSQTLTVDRIATADKAAPSEVLALPPSLSRYSSEVRGVVERDGSPYLLVEPGYFREQDRPQWAPRRVIHSPRPGNREKVRLVLCEIPSSSTRRMVFGFSGKQVLEISHRITVTPIPSAPDCVLGVCVWQGRSVPVVDLHSALSLGQSAVGLCNHTLFVRAVQSADVVAIPIGASVRSMTSRQPVYQEPNPPAMPLELVRGVFRLDRGTLIIPDIDALV